MRKASLLFSAATLFSVLLFAAPVGAQGDVFGGVCDRAGAGSSAACATSKGGDPISGDNGILSKIANIVALFAGAAAVIVIVVGGLRMVISGGDPGAVKSGRSMVIGALVGLVIIVLARSIIYFVVQKL